MKRTVCLLALATTVLAVLPDPAEAHRRHRWWGGVSIGIGVPLYHGAYAYPAPYVYGYAPVYPAYPAYPGYVVSTLPPAPAYQPVPPAPAAPEPIFYPRQGQSPAQTEADRRACNRWATTQRDAMADAGVFHRAVLACMDGRGYSSH